MICVNGYASLFQGSRVLLPLISKRKIIVTRNDLVTMLQNDDMDMPPEIVTLDPKTQEQCADHCK